MSPLPHCLFSRLIRCPIRRPIHRLIRCLALVFAVTPAACTAATASPVLASGGRTNATMRSLSVGPAPRPADVKQLSGKLARRYGQLTAANSSLADRAAAAAMLLHRGDGSALRVLAAAFTPNQPPELRRAVAQAIATDPTSPPPALLGMLLAHLNDLQPASVSDVAAAISRYRQPALSRMLLGIADDAKRPPVARRTAIRALGYTRSRRMAGRLVAMTAANQPLFVRRAAFGALTTLTGMRQPGDEHQAWVKWWRRARRASEHQWHAMLMASLSQQQLGSEMGRQQVVNRLIESQQALYRQTPTKQRPTVIARMLGDALTPIRKLGLDLALQRLLDDQNFPGPLLTALRQRLSDPSPDLRQRATILLRDLADKPAAEVIARRLAEGKIHRVECLKAALLMMQRLPRPQAVVPAYRLLQDPQVRGEAAGALAAAADAHLLSNEMARKAAKRVGGFLSLKHPPAPAVITLLGKVGSAADWRRIARWTQSSDPQIKQAAAQAWADSTRPLGLLARHAGDPVIGPIVTAAAARRGGNPQTLLDLAAHPPGGNQSQDAWQRALVAMAGRVPASTVLQTLDEIKQESARQPDFVERILTAAITADAPGKHTAPSKAYALLVLRRGQLRLATNDVNDALDDFQQLVATPGLDAPLQRAAALGLIDSEFHLGDVDKALDLAKRMINGPATQPAATQPATRSTATGPMISDHAVAALFLDNADRLAKRNPAKAINLLKRLSKLLGKTESSELAARIAEAQRQIVNAKPAATGPTAAPAAGKSASHAKAPTRAAAAPAAKAKQ